MNATFFGVSYLWWGVICLGMAAPFVMLWPSARVNSTTPALTYFLLRWGHAAVWGLLALACFVRVLGAGSGVSQVTALLALVMYLAFMVTLLRK
jgi:hypothetical protein